MNSKIQIEMVTLKAVFTFVLPTVIHLCCAEECSRNSDCDDWIKSNPEYWGNDQCCDGYCQYSCSTGVDCVTDSDCEDEWGYYYPQDICCDGKCKAVCAESGECDTDNDCYKRYWNDYEFWSLNQCCDGQCKEVCPGSGECDTDNDCYKRYLNDYEDWDNGQCCDGQCKEVCPGDLALFYFLVVVLPCILLSLLIALGGAIAYCIVKAGNQTSGTTGTVFYHSSAATMMPPTYSNSAHFSPQPPNYIPQPNDKI